MQTTTLTAPVSNAQLWTGRVLSGLFILFMLFDSSIKLVPLAVVTETSAQIGLPATAAFARTLGILGLVSLILYAYPRTAVLGAILLTAYMGGAVATHFRIGSPLFTHTLFGVYLGVILWGGLWFRDPRVRALIPFSN
ncbi:DoxX-like family protein [Mesorhizobium albiziae]|uniref:DoxX-like family protein n=1 Tax=Neomesorhizobium albiziae TaxID=335020 RepID=A0A1I4E1U0_9HYPH|nr:DoxX family protein [Mesorhizobium albiziae]GLS31173.1 membrane protein [Mesorhizobium albiziae]SFK98537.1 DoxX-like family protein [Mesorhizobium albiziae]